MDTQINIHTHRQTPLFFLSGLSLFITRGKPGFLEGGHYVTTFFLWTEYPPLFLILSRNFLQFLGIFVLLPFLLTRTGTATESTSTTPPVTWCRARLMHENQHVTQE